MSGARAIKQQSIERLEILLNAPIFTRVSHGLWHTTAVIDFGHSALHTININEHAPRSETDFGLLMASRAASHGIIQSAACVRDEFAASGSGGASSLHLEGPNATSLSTWRRDQGLPPPQDSPCVILSRGGNIPPIALRHNADSAHSRAAFTPWLMVPPAAAPTARSTMQSAGMPSDHVLSSETTSVLEAARFVQGSGALRASIEAGPSTTRSLYDGTWKRLFTPQQLASYGYTAHSKCPVDWLLLSVFSPAENSTVHPSCVGGVSIHTGDLHDVFNVQGEAFEEDTAEGTWRFAVFRNKQSAQYCGALMQRS